MTARPIIFATSAHAPPGVNAATEHVILPVAATNSELMCVEPSSIRVLDAGRSGRTDCSPIDSIGRDPVDGAVKAWSPGLKAVTGDNSVSDGVPSSSLLAEMEPLATLALAPSGFNSNPSRGYMGHRPTPALGTSAANASVSGVTARRDEQPNSSSCENGCPRECGEADDSGGSGIDRNSDDTMRGSRPVAMVEVPARAVTQDSNSNPILPVIPPGSVTSAPSPDTEAAPLFSSVDPGPAGLNFDAEVSALELGWIEQRRNATTLRVVATSDSISKSVSVGA